MHSRGDLSLISVSLSVLIVALLFFCRCAQTQGRGVLRLQALLRNRNVMRGSLSGFRRLGSTLRVEEELAKLLRQSNQTMGRLVEQVNTVRRLLRERTAHKATPTNRSATAHDHATAAKLMREFAPQPEARRKERARHSLFFKRRQPHVAADRHVAVGRSHASGGLRQACAELRVLYPSQDGWWCEGESHTRGSLGCMLTEARLLQRVLLYDEEWCVNTKHGGGGDGSGRHQRTTDHVEMSPWALSATEYVDACLPYHLEGGRYAVAHSRTPVLTLAQAKRFRQALLLVHFFRRGHPHHLTYWYSVCNAHPALPRQKLGVPEPLRRAGRLLEERVRAIAAVPHPQHGQAANHTLHHRTDAEQSSGGYVGVHVRRGDKAAARSFWPHLAKDTDVENIAAALELAGYPCGSDTVVFIASNERTPNFFQRAPLSTCYRVLTLSHLLAELREALSLGAEDNLPYTALYYVDMALFGSADHRLETFNDLTCDAKGSGGTPPPGCLTPLQILQRRRGG
jgi:hypothetical protein